MSVTSTRGRDMIARAAAIRRSRSAGASGFSGLPGLTSHQTRSSPNALSAHFVTCTCPACGGSNDPPNSPTRIPGRATGYPNPQRSRPDIAREAIPTA